MKKKHIWLPLVGLFVAYYNGDPSYTMTKPWQLYQMFCLIGFICILRFVIFN